MKRKTAGSFASKPIPLTMWCDPEICDPAIQAQSYLVSSSACANANYVESLTSKAYDVYRWQKNLDDE